MGGRDRRCLRGLAEATNRTTALKMLNLMEPRDGVHVRKTINHLGKVRPQNRLQ